MRLSWPAQAVNRGIARLTEALTDPAQRGRTMIGTLAVYVALWAVYGLVAKASQDLHPDMTEAIAWSRDLAFGYLKHPPVSAWLVRAWFTLFPVTDGAFYLLAIVVAAVSLWIAWLLAADYLDAEKRVVAVALLTLVPFFNFHALKFNVNTVLMPLWAATTLWFLRSYRLRTAPYAALAGVGAALAMMTKYWSVFLIAGLVIAALIDRRRGAYFRSVAPWVTVIVGLIVLGPHLAWLVQNNFAPFDYAVAVHGAKSFTVTLRDVVAYLGGSVAYVALPVALVLIAARPSKATLADMAWPREADRRLVAAAFWAPLLLPALAALATGTAITSLWSMSAWTLLPVLLLSPAAVKIARADTQRIVALAAIVPVVMLLASPVVAYVIQRAGVAPAAAHTRILADRIANAWHSGTVKPLRYIDGDPDLAYGVAAYLHDRPRALPGLPPVSDATLKRDGLVVVCFAEHADCIRAAEGRAALDPNARIRIQTNVTRTFLGVPGKPQRYVIVVVPPQQ
ncbi:MAG TPA: glycosyltransferase family 39 protein [Pseudolabrys sp.]|jgi:4-amino-4-deoxy-L-arabinose transferase-like glycosyltransferase|nr:glycosyltransferase family 39 protein [Pseudolabrys sp.]